MTGRTNIVRPVLTPTHKQRTLDFGEVPTQNARGRRMNSQNLSNLYADYVQGLRRAMLSKLDLPELPLVGENEDTMLKSGEKVVHTFPLPVSFQVLFWEHHLIEKQKRSHNPNKQNDCAELNTKDILVTDLIIETCVTEMKRNARFKELMERGSMSYILGRNWELHFVEKKA